MACPFILRSLDTCTKLTALLRCIVDHRSRVCSYFIRTLHPFSLCKWDVSTNAVREVFTYNDPLLSAAVTQHPDLEIHGGANAVFVGFPNVTAHAEPFYLSTFHTKDGDGVYTNYLVELEATLPFRISRISRALPLLRAPVRDNSVAVPMAFASGLAVIRPEPRDPQRYVALFLYFYFYFYFISIFFSIFIFFALRRQRPGVPKRAIIRAGPRITPVRLLTLPRWYCVMLQPTDTNSGSHQVLISYGSSNAEARVLKLGAYDVEELFGTWAIKHEVSD
jgi:hypothetical protein